MSLDSQLEREEQNLCNELNNGAIDLAEFNKQMRELQRDFRDAAEDEAQRAYDDTMGSFGY